MRGFRCLPPRGFADWMMCLRLVTSLAVAALISVHVCVPAMAQLSEPAQSQIAEIVAFKRSFSPAEQKMSSNLVLASRKARHIPLGTLERFLVQGESDSRGRLAVEIGAELSPSLMSSGVMSSAMRAEGTPADYAGGRVRAHVHPSQLLELARHSDVKFIRDADVGTTNVGAITSQAYVSHQANKAVALGHDGSGVTVGVLSDSATPNRVSALISSGDLPASVQIVPGQAGSGEDEGTAMMEIVHDMAPGANLVFATALGGQANFANNIRTLRFTYHCDIIVDDFTYFAEGAFQDGTIAKAVNDVVADGALYFSSAANSGNLTLGTSGTWEGDFLDGGDAGRLVDTLEGEAVRIHNFDASKGTQLYDVLRATTDSGISLKWSDPLAKATDDYDLIILDSTGNNIKGFSAAAQTGTQDPFEFVGVGTKCGTASAMGYCPAVGDRIVIVLFAGIQRALHLDTNRGALTIATAGSTYGHNAGLNTISMAATYWNSARTGTKPFTGAANPIERFSSDGPRKIFFNPDGTEITPGNDLFGTNGGTTLQKPDATAADGVFTNTPGFLPFFGTSAAAPHAAGIAALVKSVNLKLTNVQIRAILLSTTLDNMAPGVDEDSGYGILMALPAVQAAASALP